MARLQLLIEGVAFQISNLFADLDSKHMLKLHDEYNYASPRNIPHGGASMTQQSRLRRTIGVMIHYATNIVQRWIPYLTKFSRNGRLRQCGHVQH